MHRLRSATRARRVARRPIQAVSTDITGFVGFTKRGPYRPTLVTSVGEFEKVFGVALSPAQGFFPYA
ncbi:MAG: hypothetical protein ACM37Z_19475, partial [Deltaproteobacteria bacterium]